MSLTAEFLLAALSGIGLTPDKLVPLALVAAIAYLILHQRAIKPIGTSIDSMKKSIVEMQSVLVNAGKTLNYLLTETSSSPVRPTKFGMKLLKESGMEKIFKSQKKRYMSELKKVLKKTPTAYDVQEKAIGLLFSHRNDPEMRPLKRYAFENGITTSVILRLGGLILRDEYLKAHPKINSK